MLFMLESVPGARACEHRTASGSGVSIVWIQRGARRSDKKWTGTEHAPRTFGGDQDLGRWCGGGSWKRAELGQQAKRVLFHEAGGDGAVRDVVERHP
jgi:hypothetical protein